jgi:RNA polymerase sigma-70 factor, ECF subfamily
MTSVDPYILEQASCRASLLVATAAFRSHDWEDLKQSIVVDLLHRSQRFDPARGDWRGFVRGVSRNQAAVLAMRQRRRLPEVLGDDLVNREGAGDAESLDVLDKRRSTTVVDALHLSLDVRHLVEGLPTQLQTLALLLSEMSVQDVCRRTGRSRSRVYQMAKQIREAFLRAGFSPANARRSPESLK